MKEIVKKEQIKLAKALDKLGELIGAGTGIIQAFVISSEESGSKFVKAIFQELEKCIKEGKSIAEVFASYGDIFPDAFLETVKMGEVTGRLEFYLKKLAKDLRQNIVKLRSIPAGIPLPGIPRKIRQLTLPLEDQDSPVVVKLVNFIINQAVEDKASDIHIELCEGGCCLKYRIDGLLYEVAPPPPTALYKAIVSRFKILAGLDAAECRLPQAGRICMDIKDRTTHLLVSTLPCVSYGQNSGEKVTVRIIGDESLGSLILEQLGFSEQELITIRNVLSGKYGILPVAGVTGSGKMTTLFVLINELRKGKLGIVQIMGKWGYAIENITNVQIIPERGMTLDNCMEAAFSSDPNVIVIDDLMEAEKARWAVKAAQKGLLALGIIHAPDAVGTIREFLNFGIRSDWLAETLSGVISQKLIRRICPKCKEEYEPSEEEMNVFGLKQGDKLYKGKGCDDCKNTGFRKRAALYEVLSVTDPIRDIIRLGKDLNLIKEEAKKVGMKSMFENAVEKVKSGIITSDEVMKLKK